MLYFLYCKTPVRQSRRLRRSGAQREDYLPRIIFSYYLECHSERENERLNLNSSVKCTFTLTYIDKDCQRWNPLWNYFPHWSAFLSAWLRFAFFCFQRTFGHDMDWYIRPGTKSYSRTQNNTAQNTNFVNYDF